MNAATHIFVQIRRPTPDQATCKYFRSRLLRSRSYNPCFVSGFVPCSQCRSTRRFLTTRAARENLVLLSEIQFAGGFQLDVPRKVRVEYCKLIETGSKFASWITSNTSLIVGNHKHVLRHAFRAIYQRIVLRYIKCSLWEVDLRLKNFVEFTIPME